MTYELVRLQPRLVRSSTAAACRLRQRDEVPASAPSGTVRTEDEASFYRVGFPARSGSSGSRINEGARPVSVFPAQASGPIMAQPHDHVFSGAVHPAEQACETRADKLQRVVLDYGGGA
jgi:hypothetical protein